MRLQKKSISRVALTDLLRRKKTNLAKFLSGNGIQSYDLLLRRCDSMGVVPPSLEDFNDAKGGVLPSASSPTEGIVVVAPPAHQAETQSILTPTESFEASTRDNPDTLTGVSAVANSQTSKKSRKKIQED